MARMQRLSEVKERCHVGMPDSLARLVRAAKVTPAQYADLERLHGVTWDALGQAIKADRCPVCRRYEPAGCAEHEEDRC